MFVSRRLAFMVLAFSVLAEGLLLTVVSGSSDIVNTDDVEQLHPIMIEKHEEISKTMSKRSLDHTGYFSNYFQGEDLSSCTKCGIINNKKGNFMIIQGDVVDSLYKYPWMVRIGMKQKKSCGGSIISANYILTASHCVIGYNPQDINVLFLTNTSHLNRGPQVQKIIMHPKYDRRILKNDIALLELKTKITCDTFKSPVCLPPPNKKIPVGTVCTIAGWGRTKPQPGTNAKKLKEGKAKLVDYSRCTNMYGKRNDWPKIEYCFEGLEGKWQSSCKGDSGGPAFYESNGKYYQVGIISSGTQDCRKGYPFMLTAVPSFVNWISEVTGSGSF